jgi:hypothetical protein
VSSLRFPPARDSAERDPHRQDPIVGRRNAPLRHGSTLDRPLRPAFEAPARSPSVHPQATPLGGHVLSPVRSFEVVELAWLSRRLVREIAPVCRPRPGARLGSRRGSSSPRRSRNR